MEQSVRSDSTRMPAAQVEMRDPGTERAVTALLTAPVPIGRSDTVADTIFAAIEKDCALAAEHIRLLAISGSKPDEDPSWEPTHDASDAMWAHWDDVLLKTVPTTAAGCVALARYANEWSEREGLDLSEVGPKLFALIACSPLSGVSIAARTGPLPEPGSAEAMTAFHAACTETDRLMLAARDGYPALERADGSTWTKQSLLRALEAGEIAPAEYARLHRLAAERELRIDAAVLASDITALHALAYADSYPEKLGGNKAQDGVGDAEGSDTELLALGHRFEIAAGHELAACAKANAAQAEAEPDPRRIAETDAAANDAGNIAADLAHRIAGIPAHTADGLRLKLRALIHYSATAFADPPDMPDPDQALAHSLRMDATRLGLEPGVSSDAEARAIADAIEKLWPEWTALAERDYGDYGPEAEQRCDAMFERRMALIEAAEALPASTSRAVRYAKALAFAWYEHVGLWMHRKPLSEYGTDGRLVLDIEASLTGAPAWTGAEEPVRGRPVVNLAVKAPAQADAADAKPAPDPIKRDTDRPNLSKLSIVQLRNLYERYVQVSDIWNDALHAPWANDREGAGLRGPNVAGDLIEVEQTLVCNLYLAVVAELSRRTPSESGFEANWQLETLIRHELMCNGDLREAPALLSAIAQQWGAQA